MLVEYARNATSGIIFYSPRNMNLSADSPNLFSGPESRAAAFLVFLFGGDLRMFSVPATAFVWMWKLFRPASNPSNLARGNSQFLFCLTKLVLELQRRRPLLGPSPWLLNLREPLLEALISSPLEPRLLGVKVSYFPLPNSLWTQNVQRGVQKLLLIKRSNWCYLNWKIRWTFKRVCNDHSLKDRSWRMNCSACR